MYCTVCSPAGVDLDMVPAAPARVRHEEQGRAAEDGEVVGDMGAADVFEELHRPDGVEGLIVGRPPRPAGEVVLDDAFGREKRLLDGVLGALDAEHVRAEGIEVRSGDPLPAANVKYAAYSNYAQKKVEGVVAHSLGIIVSEASQMRLVSLASVDASLALHESLFLGRNWKTR